MGDTSAYSDIENFADLKSWHDGIAKADAYISENSKTSIAVDAIVNGYNAASGNDTPIDPTPSLADPGVAAGSSLVNVAITAVSKVAGAAVATVQTTVEVISAAGNLLFKGTRGGHHAQEYAEALGVLEAAANGDISLSEQELQELADYLEKTTFSDKWDIVYEELVKAAKSAGIPLDRLGVPHTLPEMAPPPPDLPPVPPQNPGSPPKVQSTSPKQPTLDKDDEDGNFDRDDDKPGPGTETYDNSSSSSQGYEDAGTTTGDFEPSGGEWTGGNGSQDHGTPDPSLPDNPDYTGVQPILLDLDGNGIEITELSQSTHFVDATGDGLQNRTAWAGAGDAVLFYDPARPGHPDGLNDIVETSQYIFSEWDPTASSDIEALRAVFDSNGDGVLNDSDAAFADFKLMVTNADGSTSVMTLTEAGITATAMDENTVRRYFAPQARSAFLARIAKEEEECCVF